MANHQASNNIKFNYILIIKEDSENIHHQCYDGWYKDLKCVNIKHHRVFRRPFTAEQITALKSNY